MMMMIMMMMHVMGSITFQRALSVLLTILLPSVLFIIDYFAAECAICY